MFAIAFDLKLSDAERHHPKGALQAYRDIRKILKKFRFERVQGSVYVTENHDLVNLTRAMLALKTLIWFPLAVRDIRAFRIEDWSDYTAFIKE
jgi:virulence-associated protein VapD